MKKEPVEIQRRTFLKSLAAAAVSTVIPASAATSAATYKAGSLQVWSCGGLCEAFEGANERFREKSGIQIDYTGAFAAALGKSLLGGAKTEVFAGRVLKLAQTLRDKEKMLFFKPLCFTEYALITPKGNPAGIQGIQDLARPGVRLIMPFGASPPGGDASRAIRREKIDPHGAIFRPGGCGSDPGAVFPAGPADLYGGRHEICEGYGAGQGLC
jgi:molybdate transport system substrate-binding protein